MKEYVFFDLDGVISDSKEGITKSVDYALKKFNIYAKSPDEYESFVGPPLFDNFKKECNFTDEEAKKAVEYYRVYYEKQGIFENKMYDGIDEIIKKLYLQNRKVILATSKPTEFAKQIITRYGIMPYFFDVCGSSMDNSRVKKEDVIAYAMKKNNISNPDSIIMIGDRMHDIIGAGINKIECIGVTYGYGSIDELKKYKPMQIVNSVSELETVLMSL